LQYLHLVCQEPVLYSKKSKNFKRVENFQPFFHLTSFATYAILGPS